KARAQLYLIDGDDARAQADFETLRRLSQATGHPLVSEGWAYNQAGRYGAAIKLYTESIAKAPTAVAYNDRCWARAQAGRELRAALADCDKALQLSPGKAYFLDSRGLVDLRLGRFDDAIVDYTAAIQGGVGPSSLYGRGLAELGKGEKAAGEADIAAAQKLDAKIGATYDRLGLRP
ncbi:MAG: tetratricopeptide repeat protein, partial [Caulobacteraceae bacterium]